MLFKTLKTNFLLNQIKRLVGRRIAEGAPVPRDLILLMLNVDEEIFIQKPILVPLRFQDATIQ